jgi:spore maturation protein B
MPAIMTFFGLACVFSKRDLPGAFLSGAKDGLRSGIGLLPTLVILLTAVSMFTASGAPAMLANVLSPVLSHIGIPAELVPLLITRPLSGSGSTALLSDLYETHGPDSFVGTCASVLTASSDTLVYVISVYLSAAGVKKSRHTVPAALLVMLLGIVLSCLLVRLLGL